MTRFLSQLFGYKILLAISWFKVIIFDNFVNKKLGLYFFQNNNVAIFRFSKFYSIIWTFFGPIWHEIKLTNVWKRKALNFQGLLIK